MAGVVSIKEEYLIDIANAIRAKRGGDLPITTDKMAAAIMSLSASGGITPEGILEIVENGEYDVTNYAGALVNVPDIPAVVEALEIIANGTYTPAEGVDGFSSVTVNVPDIPAVVEAIEITENGTYTAPGEIDGYNSITVNVPDIPAVIQALDVTENGTYEVPDGVDGYGPVTVNVASSGGGLPSEIETSKLDYFFGNDCYKWLIDSGHKLKVTMTANNNIQYLFTSSSYDDLSNITVVMNTPITYVCSHWFNYCYQLTKLPKVYMPEGSGIPNLQMMFNACNALKEIPEDWFMCHDANGNALDSFWINTTSPTAYLFYSLFNGCQCLRKLPKLPSTISASSANRNRFYNTFYQCYALDEITEFPVYTSVANATSGFYSSTFSHCSHLKELTFATQEDGTPYVAQMAGIELPLNIYVGYFEYASYYSRAGLDAEKQVTDAASYAALKDDPDWWTQDVNYSRYNHDSAVNTINSLPDCSAYIAENSLSNNIIKFKGASGASTDGGAINTLTEAEIAVATAKGWTVEFV